LKIRIATLSLTILCLALTAYAGTTTFYNDGGIDGTTGALYISGPNQLNPSGDYQDISNGFIAAASGTPNKLQFGEWVLEGSTPTSISYELGTTVFGTDLGFGTVTQNSSNSVLLFTNADGYGIYDVTIPVTSGAMTAGTEYWVSLSNAANTGSLQSGSWDIPDNPNGGPATCALRVNGSFPYYCSNGGESFTLTGGQTTTPEPSSILLFGSGILGLAGVLRRKLTR
jgi:hypothetical protein